MSATPGNGLYTTANTLEKRSNPFAWITANPSGTCSLDWIGEKESPVDEVAVSVADALAITKRELSTSYVSDAGGAEIGALMSRLSVCRNTDESLIYARLLNTLTSSMYSMFAPPTATQCTGKRFLRITYDDPKKPILHVFDKVSITLPSMEITREVAEKVGFPPEKKMGAWAWNSMDDILMDGGSLPKEGCLWSEISMLSTTLRP